MSIISVQKLAKKYTQHRERVLINSIVSYIESNSLAQAKLFYNNATNSSKYEFWEKCIINDCLLLIAYL